MDQLHARYPFLDAAREAVDAEGADLAALVAEDSPVVDRALARLESCLHEGTVGDPHRDPRTELLSYPVARVLVSLVDQPVLVRRYAAAEARTAHERFIADIEDDTELSATRRTRITLERLLLEFDLSRHVRETAEGFRLHVGHYLELSSNLDGEEWRLIARLLDDGTVPVSREELFVLLREAVRERVAEGLPFDVPEAIADGLASEVEQLEGLLADRRLPTTKELDAVVPEQFPPCMTALLSRVRAGEELPHHSRFTLVTFLGSIGFDEDQVAAIFSDAGAQQARFQFEHVAGDAGAAYAPPTCATMVELGDCVNKDDRCATIDHPLSYYADALADAGHCPNAPTTGADETDGDSADAREEPAQAPSLPEWEGDVASLFGRLS